MMLSGTHTRDAHEMIVAMYEEYYPQASANDAKFQLSPDKPDPLDLFDQCRAVVVPKGAVIFWSPWLLHGVAKLKTTAPAQSYIYLGFLPAVDRPEYKNIAKISEREDRIRSFEQGDAPKLYPSLDPICYYPKRFENNHNCLKKYADKTPDTWPGKTKRTLKTRRGPNGEPIEVPHFVPVLDPNYVPFDGLTPHGERMLGKRLWGDA